MGSFIQGSLYTYLKIYQFLWNEQFYVLGFQFQISGQVLGSPFK